MGIRILLVVCMLAISACGWQLRGNVERVELDSLALSGGTPEFLLQLEQALEDDDVPVYPGAPYTLRLSTLEWQSRTVALDSVGRAAEIELKLRLDWQLQDAQGVAATTRQHIATTRRYQVSAENITGASDEERLARADMQTELIERIMRALVKLATTLPSVTERQ